MKSNTYDEISKFIYTQFNLAFLNSEEFKRSDTGHNNLLKKTKCFESIYSELSKVTFTLNVRAEFDSYQKTALKISSIY